MPNSLRNGLSEQLFSTIPPDEVPFDSLQLPSPNTAATSNSPEHRKRTYQRSIGEYFSPKIRMNSTKRRRTVVDSDSDSGNLDNINFEPPKRTQVQAEEEVSDGDSDDLVSPVIRRKRMSLTSKATKTFRGPQNFADKFNEGLSEADDISPVRKSHLPQLGPEREDLTEEEEDSEADSDDIVGPNIRRRRLSGPSPLNVTRHTPQSDTSDKDLQEELRDITSFARKNSVTQRMRDAGTRNKKKSQFQKNLESLRRKKRGVTEDSEAESEHERALYDSTSDVESVGSDDFIVDDDRELTLEEMMEIPPEFTSVSYQGPQLNFKIVIQGEVYALLHPNFHALDYNGIIWAGNPNVRLREPRVTIFQTRFPELRAADFGDY